MITPGGERRSTSVQFSRESLRARGGGVLREALLEAFDQATGQLTVAAEPRQFREANRLLAGRRSKRRIHHESLPGDPQRVAGASRFEQRFPQDPAAPRAQRLAAELDRR